MIEQIKSLSDEQKAWYANAVVGAILADGEINFSEIEFLKEVLAIISDAQVKAGIMQAINTKVTPELGKPVGFSPEILAAIYLELVLIVISDIDLDENEAAFLHKMAETISFTPAYTKELLAWCEQGLNWKSKQKAILDAEGTKHTSVPIKELNRDQKNWYATVLVATILKDGVIDDGEVRFLKMAISFLDDRNMAQKLMGYVRNRMVPDIGKPPAFPKSVLTLVFIEVLMIIASDEAISYKEQTI